MVFKPREELAAENRFGKKISEVRQAAELIEGAYNALFSNSTVKVGVMCDLEEALAILRDILPDAEIPEKMAKVWQRIGEHRPPLRNEWFASELNKPEQARFDFTCQSFDILRINTVSMKSVAHEGDPCKHCGSPDKNIGSGPCRGLVYSGYEID